MTTPPTASVSIITEFVGHPREVEWEREYVQARNYAQDARGYPIHDVKDLNEDHPTVGPTLRMRVLRSSDVEHQDVVDQIEADCLQQLHRDRQLTLAFIVFGDNASRGAEVVSRALGPPSSLTRLVDNALTLTDLQHRLIEYLLLVIDRRLPLSGMVDSFRTDTETIIASEMPSTPSGAQSPRLRTMRSMP